MYTGALYKTRLLPTPAPPVTILQHAVDAVTLLQFSKFGPNHITILKIWTQSQQFCLVESRSCPVQATGVHRLILRAMQLADLNQNPSLSSRQASKLWPITCKITCTTATIQNNYNISVCGILYNDVRHSCSDLLVKTQTSVIRLSFNMFLCYCMKYLCIRMTTKTRCFSGINYQTIPV